MVFRGFHSKINKDLSLFSGVINNWCMNLKASREVAAKLRLEMQKRFSRFAVSMLLSLVCSLALVVVLLSAQRA